MRALQLALSLIRIPRMFLSLLLFPFVVGLLIVYLQLLVTSAFVKNSRSSAADIAERYNTLKEFNVARLLLFGQGENLPDVRVCRWRDVVVAGKSGEVPPDDLCHPDRLDVALKVADPQTYDPGPYVQVFNGNVARVHLCKRCRPDVVIDLTQGPPRTTISSVWGVLLLSLLRFNDAANQQLIEAFKHFDSIRGLIGDRFLYISGFSEPMAIDRSAIVIAIVGNFAGLVVVALWLALKAHRKVLDYFARSGALLPMVAATGKGSFYSAIWILTGLRVGAFMVAAIPIAFTGIQALTPEDTKMLFFGGSPWKVLLWLTTLVSGLALATLVGSIAELKQRHQFLSFAYRYIPLILSGIGTVMWVFTFLIESGASVFTRNLVAATPIIGLAPILIGPLFRPSFDTLVIHLLLTVLLFLLAARHNARWFAAHLEDL